MSTRILTLFGEELVPEPPQPRKKPETDKGEDTPAQPVRKVKEKAMQEEPEAGKGENAPAQPVRKVKEKAVQEEPAAPADVIPQRAGAAKEKVATAKKEKKAGSQKAPAHREDVPAVLSDWQPEKQYYTIGEVAGLFRVNTSHIRFWTNQFGLKVRTTRKGDRLYAPELIQELRMIYHLVKERGFTLSGAKARLKENKKGALEAVSLKQSLLNMRNHLVELRNRIT